MAGVAIGVQPWWSPRVQCELDASHPLAQGLIFCALGDFDVVSGVKGTPSGASAATASRTKYGTGVAGVDFAGRVTWPYGVVREITGLTKLSAFMAGQHSGTNGMHMGQYNSGGAGTGHWMFKSRAGVSFQCEGTNAASGTTFATGEWGTLGVTASASPQLVEFYKNGAYQSNANSVPLTFATLALDMSIGGVQSGEGNCVMAAAMIWRRPLTVSDHALLGHSPFCMIRR